MKRRMSEDEARIRLGQAIKHERDTRQWSLKRLADEMNRTPPAEPAHRQSNASTIERYEKARARIDAVRWLKLAKIFPALTLERAHQLIGTVLYQEPIDSNTESD